MRRHEIKQNIGARVKINGLEDLGIDGVLKGKIENPNVYLSIAELKKDCVVIKEQGTEELICVPPRNIDLVIKKETYRHVFTDEKNGELTHCIRFSNDKNSSKNYFIGVDFKPGANVTRDEVIKTVNYLNGMLEFRKDFANGAE